ncbi:MAG: PilZ domain-containing protein [Candidatus Rokubacteria bacterium]|nr:PilZ domain-containing protein [Candidatus Rokubacteria bacterium]
MRATFDVALEAAGYQWRGKTIDVSPDGIRVALPIDTGKLPHATCVQVRFRLPGEDRPVALVGRVRRTTPESLIVHFTDVEDQQYLQDLVGCLVLDEWQELLRQLGGARSPDSHPSSPRGAGVQPDLLPANPPVERGGGSNGAAPASSTAGQRGQPAALKTSSIMPSDEEFDQGRWQALLRKFGLELRLPPSRMLSLQWRNFLRQLEAEAHGTRTAKRVADDGGKQPAGKDLAARARRGVSRTAHPGVSQGR